MAGGCGLRWASLLRRLSVQYALAPQLLRLLRGGSVVVLLFEGMMVDRLAELLALQAVFLRSGRPTSENGAKNG